MVDMPDVKDTTAWSYDDLVALSTVVDDEIRRRYTVKSAEAQMNNLVWDYSNAIGREAGDVWSQPAGAHDAYPEGFRVSHAGKEWISLIPANVWEPGTSGWREYTPPESGAVPEYLAPTGAHDAYRAGDRVSFRGKIYESVIGSNVYSPEEFPEGWEEVDPDEAPEVPVDPPVDSEVPVEEEPTAQVFVQPTGAHDAYQIGDQVLLNGLIYESVINANTYSPTDYPAGWKTV